MPLCQIWFIFCAVWHERKNALVWSMGFTCTDTKSIHLEFSPTLNIGKLIWYFRSPCCAIVSNMTRFFIRFRMWKKVGFCVLWISPVLRQDQHNWSFYSSLTLKNEKLVWYLETLTMSFCQIWPIFLFCLAWEKIGLFWTLYFTDANPDIRNFNDSLTLTNGKTN